MFAYVKFVEDGLTYTANVKDILKFNQKYDPLKFEPMKLCLKVKYSDEQYYKAYIVAVEDTYEEAIKAGENRRIKLPNRKYFHLESSSAMEDSTADENLNKTQNLAVLSASNLKYKNKKTKSKDYEKEAYNSILNDGIPKIKTAVLIPNEGELNSLKMEITELKRKEKQHLEEITVLKNLNYELQNSVINNFKDLKLLHGARDNVVQQNENANNLRLPAIGWRENQHVHLGRGIFLPEHIYDSVCYSARKNKKNTMDGIFIKEMAMAVFGRLVLIQSSVTGGVCNRTKGPPKPKLDPTKLMALSDILLYRLEQRGEPHKAIDEIIGNVNKWIAEKIHDLTRPPKQSNPRPVLGMYAHTHEHDNIGAMLDIQNMEVEIQVQEFGEESDTS